MKNNRQGANSLSIVGRLSTFQSVYYRRFHCTCHFVVNIHCTRMSLQCGDNIGDSGCGASGLVITGVSPPISSCSRNSTHHHRVHRVRCLGDGRLENKG